MATELERIEELLAGQERKIRRAFLDNVALVRSPVVMAQIEEMLVAGDFQGAFDILESYIARVGDVLPRIQQEVGDATAVDLASQLPEIVTAISFDSSNPRAAAIVQTQRMEMIRQVSDPQLRAVQQALNRGLGEGLGVQAMARAFRNALGLTDAQEQAVFNYRRLLEARSAQALNRAFRDRRFDDRVRSAVQGGRPLTEKQIDRMVERYRARALAARAETIARQEAGRAVAEAGEEATRQMLERTGIRPERVRRKWNATGDKRTRDWHESMDGQLRGLNEPFVDGHGALLMYPHDPKAPPETTINCRCALTRVISAA